MQFIFFDAADNRLFVRDDAETAQWSVKGMTLSVDFPFVKDKEITRGMRIGFVDETGILQPFEIRKVKTYEPDHYQEVTAEHIAISELTDEFYLGTDVTDKTAAEALALLLDGTLWSVGTSTDNNTSSVDIDKGNVWQNVRNIEQNWNVWITPRVTFSTTGITGRYLDISPADGVWRGVTIDIHGNGDEMGVTVDDSDLLTAVYGLGGVPDNSQTDDPLTFADVVWEATADHPAKPDGQTYVEDPTAKSLYGRNGRNRFGYYQNGGIKDADLLLEKSWEYLKTMNAPKVTVDCIVRDLKRMGYADQGIRLHDKVQVRIQPIGQILVLTVDDLEVDLLDPTATRPTIGKYIPNIVYINRETAMAASGGSYRNGGDDNTDNTLKVFNTQIAYNDYEISLEAYQRAYQDGLLSDSLLDAWASLNISATNITGLVAGAGCQLGADGRIVLDANGFPVFTDSNPSNLYSRINQSVDEINSIVSGVSAGEFNDHTAYAKDTYVTHKENGVTKLYRFTSAHASGPWTGLDVVEVTGLFTKVSQNSEAITLKVSKGDVATQLSVECGNVTITGGDLILDGALIAQNGVVSYNGTIIADTFEGRFADIDTVSATTISGSTVSGETASFDDITGGSLTIEGSTADAEITNAKALGLVYGLTLTPPASGSSTYTLSWTTVDGTQHSETFSRAASVRTVRTLTPNGGSVNVGSKVYTINANIVYTDNDTGVSDIQIPLVVGSYDSANTAYPVTVAGISGISVSATGAYNEGYDDCAAIVDITSVTTGAVTASGGTVTIPVTVGIGDLNSTWKTASSSATATITQGTPTWGAVTSGNSNTFTVEDSAGASTSQSVYLSQDSSWASGTKNVYLTHTNSSLSNQVAVMAVNIPSITNPSAWSGTSTQQTADETFTLGVGYDWYTLNVSCGGRTKKLQVHILRS